MRTPPGNGATPNSAARPAASSRQTWASMACARACLGPRSGVWRQVKREGIDVARPACVDLHVVRVSHQDFASLTERGRFRADLIYRLTGASITVPALRDRADKIDLIRRVLASEANELKMNREARSERSFCLGLLSLARQHPPASPLASNGDRRLALGRDRLQRPAAEPRSKRGSTVGQGNRVDAADDRAGGSSSAANALLDALRQNAWCVADTARSSRLSRQALYRKMKRLGIVSPNRTDAANAENRRRGAHDVWSVFERGRAGFAARKRVRNRPRQSGGPPAASPRSRRRCA